LLLTRFHGGLFYLMLFVLGHTYSKICILTCKFTKNPANFMPQPSSISFINELMCWLRQDFVRSLVFNEKYHPIIIGKQ